MSAAGASSCDSCGYGTTSDFYKTECGMCQTIQVVILVYIQVFPLVYKCNILHLDTRGNTQR